MSLQMQLKPQDRLPNSWENLTVVIEGQGNNEVGRARFSPPVLATIQSLVKETLIICIGRRPALRAIEGHASFAISGWNEQKRILNVIILPNGIQ